MRNKTFTRFAEFAKKFDTILFILGLILVGILLFGIANAYACSGDECKKDSNVADINNGNKGYIFTYYCEKGAESLGKWVDPKDVPELKGDKGDTGATGSQGIQGIQGLNGINGKDGINGINGIDGKDGLNGAKGNTGEQGIQGDKGDKGDTGAIGQQGLQGNKGDEGIQGNIGMAGKDGLNGEKGDEGNKGDLGTKGDIGDKGDTGKEGYTPIKNIDYFDGLSGLDGKDVDPIEVTRLDNRIDTSNININNEAVVRVKEDIKLNNRINDTNNRVDDLDNRVNKLEETQFVLETSFRILDTKRISLRPFFRQNFTRNKVDVVGLKIEVKLGQSYEEKLINKINIRLDLLEKTMGNAPVIEKVVDKKGNVKSISIVGNGLKVKGEF